MTSAHLRARGKKMSSFLFLLALMASLQMVHFQQAATFKLPSFLAWIQPSSSSSSAASNSYLATSGASMPVAVTGQQAKQASHQLEPLLVSASSQMMGQDAMLAAGNAAPTTTTKTAKKTFPSMLLLPSKHNQIHLLSALPRSLFSRLFGPATQQSRQPVQQLHNQQQHHPLPLPLRQHQQLSRPQMVANFKPLYPMQANNAPLPQQVHLDEQQLVRQALAASAAASARQVSQMVQARPYGFPSDFMRAPQVPLHGARQPAPTRLHQQQQQQQHQQQQQQHASFSQEYREIPAIVISEQATSAIRQPAGEPIEQSFEQDSLRLNVTQSSQAANETGSASGNEPAANPAESSTALPDSYSASNTGSSLSGGEPNRAATDPTTTAAASSQADTMTTTTGATNALGGDTTTALSAENEAAIAATANNATSVASEQEPAVQVANKVNGLRQTSLSGEQQQQTQQQDDEELGSAASQMQSSTNDNDELLESFILGPYRPTRQPATSSLEGGLNAGPFRNNANSFHRLQQQQQFNNVPLAIDQMVEQQSVGAPNWHSTTRQLQPQQQLANTYPSNLRFYPKSSPSVADENWQSLAALASNAAAAAAQYRQRQVQAPPSYFLIRAQQQQLQQQQQQRPVVANGQSQQSIAESLSYFIDRPAMSADAKRQTIADGNQSLQPAPANANYKALPEQGQRPLAVTVADQVAKFKSGLYQIEPPKLPVVAAEQSQPQPQPTQQQQQQVELADSDSALNDSQQQSSKDEQDEDEAKSEQDQHESLIKQVGASMGVAQRNQAARKGQVLDEPLNEQTSGQMKSLRLAQDVTLYDFELNNEQVAGNAAHLAWAEQPDEAPPKQSDQYLDTQVYTIPYTLTMHPNQGARIQQSPPRAQHLLAHPLRSAPQLGRFPLPYLAPPPPQQPRPQQQQPHNGPVWPQAAHQLASVSALTVQPLPESIGGKPLTQQGHYYHYQPVVENPHPHQHHHHQQQQQQHQHQHQHRQQEAPTNSVPQLQHNYAITIKHEHGNGLELVAPAPQPSPLPALSAPVLSEQPQTIADPSNQEEDETAEEEISNERPQLAQLTRVTQSRPPSEMVSTPSVFCADRAPGLYADQTQRCRTYYQCAPTGHQMFRCNNQTQFNQKTQNCDWWYNVECDGRLGSLADFDQPAVLSVDPNSIAVSNSSLAHQFQQDSELASATAPSPVQERRPKSASWASRLSSQQQPLVDQYQIPNVRSSNEAELNLQSDNSEPIDQLGRQQVVEPSSSTSAYAQQQQQQSVDTITQRSSVSTDSTLIPESATQDYRQAATTSVASTTSAEVNSQSSGGISVGNLRPISSEEGTITASSGSSNNNEDIDNDKSISSRPQVGDELLLQTTLSTPGSTGSLGGETTTGNLISSSSSSSSASPSDSSDSSSLSTPANSDQVTSSSIASAATTTTTTTTSDPVTSLAPELVSHVSRREEPETAPGFRFESSRRHLATNSVASGQQPHSNHRYSSTAALVSSGAVQLLGAAEQAPIYSTGSYQGSVNYTPTTDRQQQVQSDGPTVVPAAVSGTAATLTTARPGVERRFGARLLNPKQVDQSQAVN